MQRINVLRCASGLCIAASQTQLFIPDSFILPNYKFIIRTAHNVYYCHLVAFVSAVLY